MEHSECGLACVSMICNYFNYNMELSTLREKYGVPNGGYTLFQLSEILKSYNYSTRGVKITNITSLDKNLFPFIGFWNKKHFVIIEKATSKRVLISDPANTRRWISKKEFEESFSNSALLCYPNENFQEKKDDCKTKFFLSILFKEKKLLVTLLVLSVLIQVIGVSVPFITKSLVDNIIFKADTEFLNKIGLSILVFSIFYYFMNFSRHYVIVKLQSVFDSELMSNLLEHMLKLPYTFFTNRSSGELIFRFNSNVYVRQILSQKLVSLVIDFFLIFVYLYIMLKYSVSLTVIILIISGLIITVSIFSTYKVEQITNDELISQAKVQKILNETVNGILTIKSLGTEDLFLKNWKTNFNKQLYFTTKKGKWSALLSNIPYTVQFMLALFITWYGSYQVGSGTFTIGTLLAFNTVAASFLQPIISISGSYMEILVLRTYINKWYDILNTNPESRLDKECFDIKDGTISFEHINFKYNEFSPYILKDINLDIKPCEKIAIVGKSGSGKSTLLKMILGLYNPKEGRILIDNLDMSQMNIRNLRNQIGVVLQEPQLFNASIRENILLGKENIDDGILSKAIERAGIMDIIKDSPLGIDTILSENGVNLSGGQRQKISLARALINNPKILLMDEPTSSLDNQSEKGFMDQVFGLKNTCIVVAHRLSTIDKFDRILVIDKGRIVEQGTHKELLNLKGYYYNLYDSGENSPVGVEDLLNCS